MMDNKTVKGLAQNESAWFVERRLQYLKSFETLGLPLWKYGIGIMVDIRDLDLTTLHPSEAQEEVVIADKQVEMLPFKEALQKYGDEIKEYLIQEEPDKMDALHNAFINSGLYVRIPEGVVLKKPIVISTDVTNKTRIENIIVVAEENTKATLLEVTKGGNNTFALKSQRVYIHVKQNAHLQYKTIQTLDYHTHNFSKRYATVEQDASIEWVDCALGAKLNQVTTTTSLIRPNARGKNRSIVFGDKAQCFDMLNKTFHQASQTTSTMVTKVVLNEQARSVYRGLVKVHPKAAACVGFQKEDTLLLSEDARSDAVPNLEISNDNVQCNHAATVSQVDEEKLFYMMTRGLGEQDAKKAIVEGFFAPVVAEIREDRVLHELQEAIQQRIKKVQ